MATNDALALSVLEVVLQDPNIQKRLQDILVPDRLVDAISTLTHCESVISNCRSQCSVKSNKLKYLRNGSTRCFHGTAEQADGEDTDAQFIQIVNDVMKLEPPMLVDHLERNHRLWAPGGQRWSTETACHHRSLPRRTYTESAFGT